MENVDATFTGFIGNLILPGYGDYRNARRTGDIVMDARLSFQATENGKSLY